MTPTFSGVGPVKTLFIFHIMILVSMKTNEGNHKIIVSDKIKKSWSPSKIQIFEMNFPSLSKMATF